MPILAEVGYDKAAHDDAISEIERTDDIPKIIEDLARKYQRLYLVDARQINEGMCEDFAHDLRSILGRGEVKWADDMKGWSSYKHGWHAFLILAGRYYDSESPYGEDDWRHLPFFTELRAGSPYGEADGLSGDCEGRSPEQASATQPL